MTSTKSYDEHVTFKKHSKEGPAVKRDRTINYHSSKSSLN